MPKIEPCAVCGTPDPVEWDIGGHQWFSCRKVTCNVYSSIQKTRREAIAAWNNQQRKKAASAAGSEVKP